jgi:hypothetical protein
VGQSIRLNPGNFFDRMGLGHRPTPPGRCPRARLLSAPGTKRSQYLLRSDHDIQTQIATVASARAMMNQRASGARSESGTLMKF